MTRWIALLAALLLHLPAWPLSVVFINPGKSDEVYWVTVTRAMQAAAKSLDVNLEVQFAERQHSRVLEIAQQVIARPDPQRPDFVIFSNDYALGPELLRLFDAANIKTFLAFSGISEPNERAMTGSPRQRYKGWLGSLEPQADDAGYLTAQALLAHGRKVGAHTADGKLHLLAISGDRSTPVSLRRSEGMRRAISEASDAVLDQEVYAEWNRDKAAEKVAVLYQRYPGARLVWAGSDQMAFGSMQAWEKRGGQAGKDAWFSGINTSREAMDAVQSGRLSALAGGHFIAGAWALVMLYDYANGRDFASKEGLELNQPMFSLFNPAQAALYVARFGDMRFDQVDFRQYSKTRNPQLKQYDFSFGQLLR
jgi:ABC-type sugar transport system substrate-binding protein